MNEHVIERLSRQLGGRLDRRTLGGLTGLGLASWAMAPMDADAKKKRKKKKKKKKATGTQPSTTPPSGGCRPACGAGTSCVNGACVSITNLQAAIDAAAAGATVTLNPGTLSLFSTLTIDRNLTLRGDGAGKTVIDGNQAVRVLTIQNGATVTLEDLTIANGWVIGPDEYMPTSYGGILNEGTLHLRGVEVTNCKGLNTGGIRNGGSLHLHEGTRIHGNHGTHENSSGGGIMTEEGATTTLHSGSEVSGNSAGYGGGLYTFKGELTLGTGSRVSGNSARMGGGVYSSYDSMLTLQDGSVVGGNAPEDGNTATDSGGGIHNVSHVILESGSRVVGNSAHQGGGLYNDYFRGTITLKAGSRVSGNSATTAGAIWNDAGATIVETGALVCDNIPLSNQCDKWSGSISGACPISGGVCPG